MKKQMTHHINTVKKNAGCHEDPVDFVLHTLRTSDLPTVVVEGEHDKQIYRWLEDILDTPHVNLLSAKGRPNLLKVFEKREKFEDRLPVVFMADLDKWVFSGSPLVYSDIIWTQGYSIENDLYSDGNPETLIPSDKAAQHSCELNNAIQKFAREVALWEAGRIPTANINKLVEAYQKIIEDKPELRLRGKTLFELLLPVCGARNHLELCKDVFSTVDLENNHPPLLSRLVWEIQRKIAEKRTKIAGRSFIGKSLFTKISEFRESVSDSSTKSP